MTSTDDLRTYASEHFLNCLSKVTNSARGCLLNEQIARVGMLKGKLH